MSKYTMKISLNKDLKNQIEWSAKKQDFLEDFLSFVVDEVYNYIYNHPETKLDFGKKINCESGPGSESELELKSEIISYYNSFFKKPPLIKTYQNWDIDEKGYFDHMCYHTELTIYRDNKEYFYKTMHGLGGNASHIYPIKISCTELNECREFIIKDVREFNKYDNLFIDKRIFLFYSVLINYDLGSFFEYYDSSNYNFPKF